MRIMFFSILTLFSGVVIASSTDRSNGNQQETETIRMVREIR
jgi:hypothetical protein